MNYILRAAGYFLPFFPFCPISKQRYAYCLNGLFQNSFQCCRILFKRVSAISVTQLVTRIERIQKINTGTSKANIQKNHIPSWKIKTTKSKCNSLRLNMTRLEHTSDVAWSFSDTKLRKNIIQHILIRYFSRYLTQKMQTTPDIQGQ